MARPSKLNKALTARMAELIKAGSYAERAAQLCSIAPSTYYTWMRNGRDAQAKEEEGLKLTAADKRYLEFMKAIKEAEAHAEALAVAQIRKAAQDGQWTAAAWYLERKFAERWGKVDRHQVETTVREAEKQTARSSDQLLQELQKLEREGK